MKRLVMVFTFFAILFISQVSFAEESYVKTYKFEQTIQMNGVTSSTSKFFYVNPNWKVREGRVTLLFTKSELLQRKDATMTVYVNDIPIQSISLGGDKVYKSAAVVTIPPDVMKEGYNELKIRTYKRISDDICQDDANTANWLVIHEGSAISFVYEWKKVGNELRFYPDLLLNNEGAFLNTAIVIPDTYTADEVRAGMIVSGNIGQRKKFDAFQIAFMRYSDFGKNGLNMMYIGTENNSPKEILDLLTEEEREQLKHGGLLKMVNRSQKEKGLLLLAQNGELLAEGARLLSNEVYLRGISEDTFFFGKDFRVEEKEKEEDNRVSLEELGYENIFLRGPYTQGAEVEINSSKNERVKRGTKLHAFIRYANNLDFERSLVTVYVNNIPIGSKKLVKEKSDGDELSFAFPKDVIAATSFQVRIVFQLELLDRGCVSRDTENPWAYVGKDSYVDFVYEKNEHLLFTHYPAPFVEDGKWNDVTVVAPAKMDASMLTDLGNLVVQMGRELTSSTGELQVVFGDKAEMKRVEGNAIVFGTPTDNPFIRELNQELHVAYSKDYRRLEPNEKVPFLEESGKEMLSMQLIPSPFEKGKTTLVVTAPNKESLHLSRKYMSDTTRLRSLQGDCVVIDENGNVLDVTFAKVKEPDEKETKDFASPQVKTFVVLVGIMLLLVLLTIGLLVRKYRK